MKFIERNNIDFQKWNKRITNSKKENVFCYSWYLDAVAENWGALVSDDEYSTILPIPYTMKFGKKHFYQAFFTREYSIFGNDFNWQQALTYIEKNFPHLQFRTAEVLNVKNVEEFSHQEIMLSMDYKSNYRSNAKRLIKKGLKFHHFEISNDPQFLIDLFKTTVGHKINAIGPEELAALLQLMKAAINNNNGELIAVKNESNEIVAGGFFLKDKKRITYLKGAANDTAKKSGAMFALFDYSFERYATKFDTFDFGGSNIENVAAFYKKFGATDRIYYNYTIDNTAIWFKTLKRMKGILK